MERVRLHKDIVKLQSENVMDTELGVEKSDALQKQTDATFIEIARMRC